MQPANREITKAINQFNILNTIRRSGLISRVEIAEITGQSRAAVTNFTAHLIKEGIQNKQIAERLQLSIRTVEVHRYNIRRKLGLKDQRASLRGYLKSLG